MTITFTKKGIHATGKDAQALFDAMFANAGTSALTSQKPTSNAPASAPDQSQRVPEPHAGVSGPAAAENGSKAPESKGA